MRRAFSVISAVAAAPLRACVTPDQRASIDRAFAAYTASLDANAAKWEEERAAARWTIAAPMTSAVATAADLYINANPIAIPIGILCTACLSFVPAMVSEAVEGRYQRRCDMALARYELQKKHALGGEHVVESEKT